eukprot:23868-Eustigmatos_ZCMA.PRE.1
MLNNDDTDAETPPLRSISAPTTEIATPNIPSCANGCVQSNDVIVLLRLDVLDIPALCQTITGDDLRR